MQAKILLKQIGKRECKQKKKEHQRHARLAFQYQQDEEFFNQEEIEACHKANTRSNACQQYTSNRSPHKPSKRFINSDKGCGYGKDNKTNKSKKMDDLSENREANPGIFCICRGTNDGITPMLECDICNDWFHFSCVNISVVPEVYKCPICRNKINKNFWEREVSPLDLLILAAENKEKSSEVKSENSESKNKTVDEVKDNSQHLHDEDPEPQLFQLTRAAKLVLESPK